MINPEDPQTIDSSQRGSKVFSFCSPPLTDVSISCQHQHLRASDAYYNGRNTSIATIGASLTDNQFQNASTPKEPERSYSLKSRRRTGSIVSWFVPAGRASTSPEANRGSFLGKSFQFKDKKEMVLEMSKTKALLLFLWKCCSGPGVILAHMFFWGISTTILLCFADNGKGLVFSELNTITIFLGGFLSFALVFRTNICYARWWEGRCLWGSLIYAAINVVQQGRTWIHDENRLHRLACAAIAFGYACKAHLRSSSLEVDDGDFLVEKGILCQEELDAIEVQQGWQPYYFLDVMRAVINQECDGALKTAANTMMSVGVAQHMALEDSINVLSTAIGGMIRVKATGLPQGYNNFILILSIVFFAVASIRFTPDVGWWTPVIIGVIYHVVRLIMVIGDCMEDPFGTASITDLPADLYCDAIGRQIKAVYDRKIILSYNLGIGPLKSTNEKITEELKTSLYNAENDENA